MSRLMRGSHASVPIDPQKQESERYPRSSHRFKYHPERLAILAACDRFEKAQEFKAQHGPVKIIMQDGKVLES
jgi:hypothetical protein